MRPILVLFALLGLTGLAGCAGSGGRQMQPAYYDLGTPSRAGGGQVAMLRTIEVQAPSWLGSSAMQYRLAYADGARREGYAESRWAAPPAELLEVALRRRLASGEAQGQGATAGCRLRIDLDEFVQVFDSPKASHAVIEARALLMAARGDRLLALRSFSLKRNTLTPDARGGVAAIAALTGDIGDEISVWLAGLAKNSAKDSLAVPDGCAGS